MMGRTSSASRSEHVFYGMLENTQDGEGSLVQTAGNAEYNRKAEGERKHTG
jgi:hypothetical protein